jgi:hypothetical protein
MIVEIRGSDLPGLRCGPAPDGNFGLRWGTLDDSGSFTVFRAAKLSSPMWTRPASGTR